MMSHRGDGHAAYATDAVKAGAGGGEAVQPCVSCTIAPGRGQSSLHLAYLPAISNRSVKVWKARATATRALMLSAVCCQHVVQQGCTM